MWVWVKAYNKEIEKIPGEPGQLRVKDDQEWWGGPEGMQKKLQQKNRKTGEKGKKLKQRPIISVGFLVVQQSVVQQLHFCTNMEVFTCMQFFLYTD